MKYDDLLVREAIFLYWREAAAWKRGPASAGMSLPRPIIQPGNDGEKGKVVSGSTALLRREVWTEKREFEPWGEGPGMF